MKKSIISGTAFLLLCMLAKAQAPVGLDSVIVEKYYVSDANDKTVDATGGVLPLHSVTYRVFVDMKPGYTFEAAYGVDSIPHAGAPSAGDHELRIETTTTFFNNIDRGNTTPGGSFTKTQAQNNTVMLDSWFTAGAACTGQFGVLKSEDNGVANAVNTDGVLQNADPYAGIPLTVQDGFLAPSGTVTIEPFNSIGITSAQLGAFGDGVTYPNGSLLSTWNGSWFSNNSVGNGATGPTATNRVLIGQFTTDGTFSFMLNLQLGRPTGGSEKWVANSQVGNEATHPTLTYSNTPTNVGIANHSSARVNFNVYPSPANNDLTIEINKTTPSTDNHYTVYGVDGKVVLSKSIGSISGRYQEKVDLSSVAPGLYFVEVTSDGARSTKKFTKN